MAIVKMKRLQILALERDHDAMLRRLQHMGCVEISEPDTASLPDSLRRCDTAAADCLARQRQLQTAMDTLRRTAPPPKAGLLTPRPRISERDYLDEASLAAELETARRINELAADINRLTAKETQLRSEQAALRPWRSLDVPLELTETRWCDITSGTLPPFARWDEVQGALAAQIPEAEAYLLYADREQQCILLLTHKTVTAAALELLRSFGFAGGQLKGRHGTPEENLTALGDALRQTAAEKEDARQALAALGVTAEVNGRNDMTIDGQKFSGNSQYLKEGRVMHHGTIMFDSDLDRVAQALHVDQEKIAAKGVVSVRSRVTTVRQHMPHPVELEEFRRVLLDNILAQQPGEEYIFTEADKAQIARLREQRYATWEWNYGQSRECEMTKKKRFPACGGVEAHLSTDHGVIEHIAFTGDFFSVVEPEVLAEKLVGVRLEEQNLREALAQEDAGRYFSGLKNEELIELLLS